MKLNCLIIVYMCIVIYLLVQDVTGIQTAISSGTIGDAGSETSIPTNTQSGPSGMIKVGVVGGSSVSSGSITSEAPHSGSTSSSASPENTGTSSVKSSLTPKVIHGTGIIGGNVGLETTTSSSASPENSGTSSVKSSLTPKVIHGTGIIGGNVGLETTTSSSASPENNGTSSVKSSLIPTVKQGTGIIGDIVETTTNPTGVNTVNGNGTIRNVGSGGSNVSSVPVNPNIAILINKNYFLNKPRPPVIFKPTGNIPWGSTSNTTVNNTGQTPTTTRVNTVGGFGFVGDTNSSFIPIVNCGDPGRVRNAARILTGTSLFNTVDYFCYSGTAQYGYLTRTCLLNGTWSGYPPKCTKSQKAKTECGHPEVRNGSSFVQNRPYYVGYVMHYTCDYGHIYASGNLNRTCQANRTWSGSPPLCRIVHCPIPALVTNANRLVHGQNFQNTIQYNCTPPYVYESGSLTRTCQANDQWSGLPPVCGLPLRSWPILMQRMPGCRGRFELERQKLLQTPGEKPVFTFKSFIQRIRSMGIYDRYLKYCLNLVMQFNI